MGEGLLSHVRDLDAKVRQALKLVRDLRTERDRLVSELDSVRGQMEESERKLAEQSNFEERFTKAEVEREALAKERDEVRETIDALLRTVSELEDAVAP